MEKVRIKRDVVIDEALTLKEGDVYELVYEDAHANSRQLRYFFFVAPEERIGVYEYEAEKVKGEDE